MGVADAEARLKLEVGKLQLRGDSSPPKASNSSLLQDLVTWVTASFLHIPHAEDIPSTVTMRNWAFLLQPYNFFNEDPSTPLAACT